MKSNSNIVLAIQNLKMAFEYFEDFQRENPHTKGADLTKKYTQRISWIMNDFITAPCMPEVVRIGAKKEWESDPFAIPAICEKISLLPPEQRDMIETIIDACLKGQTVKINE